MSAVTLDRALQIVSACRDKAEEIGVKMNVAVVDGGGNLVAFARMDGAWLGRRRNRPGQGLHRPPRST